MLQKMRSELVSDRRSLVARACVLVSVIFAGLTNVSAVAQQETETSPIVQELTVTASVQPSCAFWLDRNWMSLGVYEGSAIMAENGINMQCSVLPSNLAGNPINYAPACFDAGQNFRPQADVNDRLSPRTMLRLGGDANDDNDRLDYVILDQAQSQLVPNPTASIGTSVNNPICRNADPSANHHPGNLYGWAVGPGGSHNEQPDVTHSLPFFIYIFDSTQQPGTPAQGNYSDTVTVYFVFKDPEGGDAPTNR